MWWSTCLSRLGVGRETLSKLWLSAPLLRLFSPLLSLGVQRRLLLPDVACPSPLVLPTVYLLPSFPAHFWKLNYGSQSVSLVQIPLVQILR